MEVQNVMCMTGGEGDTSYAKNSGIQEGGISKAKPILQNTIIDLYSKSQSPKCFTIADLGCSSGPNALLVVYEIFEAIESICKRRSQASPQLQVFLNDLAGNDWNTLFKSIPSFAEKIQKRISGQFGPYFISARPGSFYGRLFPTDSLNFVHSSYGLQILSQVPPGIENNKGNIFIAPTSPPNVPEAYLQQYKTDFTLFLTSRSQELVPGGRMVLIFVGRSSSDISCMTVCQDWDLLAQSLRDMVSEGLVEEAKLDSFNWPGYYPTCEELKAIVEEEGTFSLDILELMEEKLDPSTDLEDKKTPFARGKYVSNFIRAVTEPMLIRHFGEEIIDNLFDRYAVHIGMKLAKGNSKLHSVIMSMTKKE